MFRFSFIAPLALLLTSCAAHAQSITCNWTDNSNNESGFSIERASSLDGPFGAPIATVDTNVTTFTDTGLTVGDLACYRVRAWNDIGFSGYSNIACATVKALPVPTDQVSLACAQTTGDPSLALWYKFDNDANDSSGNNRTGIAAGAATYATGKVGLALSLTGTDGRVRSPLTSSPTVSTVMVWAKRSGAGGGSLGRMFDKRTSGLEVETFYNDDPTAVYRYIRCWSSTCGSWTIPQPGLNVWHHIAIVYDSSLATNDPKIYLDGVAQVITQKNQPSGTLSTNADPYVVGNRGAADRGWNGMLDDFRIYSKALSQADIQKAMAGQ